MMETIEEGCPLCESDVRGNPEEKYYCKKCNYLFDEIHVKKMKVEEEPDIELIEDVEKGKLALTGIEREKGYLYFIDKEGDVSRVKMAKNRSDKGPKIHEKILKVGVNKKKGYLYYLDKDGDIARTPMKRGAK